jgi:hypothetical protein
MLGTSAESESGYNCRWQNDDMTGTCGQVPLSQLQICLFSRDVEGKIFVDVDIPDLLPEDETSIAALRHDHLDETVDVTPEVAADQVSAFRLLLADPSSALSRLPHPRLVTLGDPQTSILTLQLHLRLTRCGWPGSREDEEDEEHPNRAAVPLSELLWVSVCDLVEFWWSSVWGWSKENSQVSKCQRDSVRFALEWPQIMHNFVNTLAGTISILIFISFSTVAVVVESAPSSEALRLFAEPRCDSEPDLSSVGIDAGLFKKIRGLYISSPRDRQAQFQSMFNDCQASRSYPSSLRLPKRTGKTWTEPALQVCLLAFEVIQQLIQAGFDPNVHKTHEFVFLEAAQNWLANIFRLWTFPMHEVQDEKLLIECAFSFAWKGLCTPSLPAWFKAVRDVYIALPRECFSKHFQIVYYISACSRKTRVTSPSAFWEKETIMETQ